MNVENISELYAEVLITGTSQVSCTKVTAVYDLLLQPFLISLSL